MPSNRNLDTGSAKFPSWKRGSRKLLNPFVPAAVTLGSPSDNTTPRCQMVARGRFLPFQTLKLLHWVLSGGAGWPGRGSDFKANSTFQSPRIFQEALNRSYLRRCLFVGTRLHKTGQLIDADRSGQPEPPGSTRCSMPATSQLHRLLRFYRWCGQRTEIAHLVPTPARSPQALALRLDLSYGQGQVDGAEIDIAGMDFKFDLARFGALVPDSQSPGAGRQVGQYE